jgi:hypothetical protein
VLARFVQSQKSRIGIGKAPIDLGHLLIREP